VTSTANDDSESTLRPNRFRPKIGTRNRLRSRLQTLLTDDENVER
jgi:hypothetical protein